MKTILETVRESAKDLHDAGVIDDGEMEEFDEMTKEKTSFEMTEVESKDFWSAENTKRCLERTVEKRTSFELCKEWLQSSPVIKYEILEDFNYNDEWYSWDGYIIVFFPKEYIETNYCFDQQGNLKEVNHFLDGDFVE